MYNNALCQHLNSSYTSRSLYGHIMWCQNRAKYSAFEMSSVTKIAFELTQCYTTRRHDNTTKSWLRASVLCNGVVTLHSASAVELLQMVLSGQHNKSLLYSEESPSTSFLTGISYKLSTFFPGTLEWYRCVDSWQTTWTINAMVDK